MHLAWGFTWTVISAPGLLSLKYWSDQKTIALARLTENGSQDSVKLLNEISPIGGPQLIIATVLALGSFIAPAFGSLKLIFAGR